MSDRMLWRYDDDHVMVAVDSAQVVQIGDIVWLNTDDVRAADQVSFTGGINTAQELLVDTFLGVAMQRSANGDTAEIRVKTDGVFEFDCASATAEIGDLQGADDNATPDALENQKVIKVTDEARAIGRCAKRNAAAATKIYVKIRSTIMAGGVQKGEASA